MERSIKHRDRLRNAFIMMLILGLGLSFTTLATAAKPKIVPIEGTRYNVEAPLTANLRALEGKRVYVTLSSGKTLTGLVKKVGKHLLHIEKLAGKEYFDALIRIADIAAIDTQFRKLQR